MSVHDPENGGQQSPDSKFTKQRDLMLLMGKVHSDRIGGSKEKDSPAYWGDELMKILSGLAATKQMENWQPDVLDKILSRDAPEVRFVRKIGDNQPELSDTLRLPRYPREFLLALDAYTQGKSWEEILQTLNHHQRNAHDEQTEALEYEASSIKNLDDAGMVAKKILATLKEGSHRNTVMGFLNYMVARLLRSESSKCTDFASLQNVYEKLKTFFQTDNGKLFRQSVLMDVLDNKALEIGRELLSRAITQDQVNQAIESIRSYPFEFAFVYEAPISETREDALAKLELLAKIRTRYSKEGLEKLRREVEKYEFQSTQMAPKYKEQIIAFIDRKQKVYWPEQQRKYMPRP